ncbi:hypothetical protein TNCV_3848801 [Trichonephila clavipes]|uniref:Uncharacterized protein n=1 Tax=Trichonephila clavipes TaxID=2585209 RepID=A0A8X6R8W6_TRICX|nr:hypothetical protein TNCV_3848801 [Trichonephila clavipes]
MDLHREEMKALAMFGSGSLFVLGSPSFHFPSGIFSHPLTCLRDGKRGGGVEKESHISGFLGAQIATSEEEKKALAADSIRRT